MAPHKITITIRKFADLFVDSPDDNPLAPEWEAFAGIQRVANFLTTRRLAPGVEVTIQVPDTLELPPNVMDPLREAIDRYCDARIVEHQRERAFKIRTGLTGLAYSLVISFVLAVGLGWLLMQIPMVDWLSSALEGLVTIGAWAILWGPLAAIFYDWLPNWTAIRVYKVIRKGTFILRPIPIQPLDTRFTGP